MVLRAVTRTGELEMKNEVVQKRFFWQAATPDLLLQVHREMPKRLRKPNGLSEILRKAKGGFSHRRLRRGIK